MIQTFQENIFTPTDYAIVRAAVKHLPALLRAVVELRFWEKLTLDEIAIELGVTVRTVEEVLTEAGRKLREECLRHPAFSRSQIAALQFMRSKSA